MKKEKYYCDYCGKECKHTEDIVIPTHVPIDAISHGITVAKLGFELKHIQKDVCIPCQEKMAYLLGLMTSITVDVGSPGSMCITFES